MDISKMTLEMKIGQMIMAGFPTDKYDEHIRTLIEKCKIGNIILFSRNIGSVFETAGLVREIQEAVIKNTGIPALISADQEGGTVTRIRNGVTFFPGNMAVSASGIEDAALNQGRITGRELRNLGVNLNIAPVLDINNNRINPVIGVRSYGDTPETVSKLGSQFIKGAQAYGTISAAKHFPGHGDTTEDSHLSLPRVGHDINRLRSVELVPFIEAIRSGVDAIMTAHVLFPAIECEELPATLSYKVLTKLLRNELGFSGIIMTDCMEMNAIAAYYGTEKASVMAVLAGADMICVSHTLELQLKSYEAIKKAVLRGEIKEERINESVERILKIKEKYRLFEMPYPDEKGIKDFNNSPDNAAYARCISEKSITVVRDEMKLLPVSGRVVSISTDAVVLTGAENEIKKEVTFCEAVRGKFGGEAFTIPLNPDSRMIDDIVKASAGADRVVIGTYNAVKNPEQLEMIKSIMKVNKNIIAVALRSPYETSLFEKVSTIVCTYEYNALSVESTIGILAGSIKPSGRLPIKL